MTDTAPARRERPRSLPAALRAAVALIAAVTVIVVGVAGLFASPASAGTFRRPETRVGAFGPTGGLVVGAHEPVLAGQRRARAPNYDQTAVGSCVAAERDLEAEATAARDAKAAEVGRAKATVVGGYDPETGQVVAGCNSNPIGCAEDDVTRQLGGDPSKPRFTGAIRPRTGDPVPVCARCQGTYDPSQFAPGTLVDPGPWGIEVVP